MPECGRSREGAWIEITRVNMSITVKTRRSREGAWIEIMRFTEIPTMTKSLPRGSVD